MFYLTCARCRAKPATNGALCVACCAEKHSWGGGTVHRQSCRVCGVTRYKRRKRTYPGQQGSRWQTWYDIDPDSGEKPNPMPGCK